MTRDHPLLPYAVTLAAVGLFSLMDALMKGAALAAGAYSALLLRNLFGLALVAPVWLAKRSGWPTRAAMRVHVVRGFVAAAMAFTFFWGIARVPLAEGIALSFVAPLVALYLAALLLKERIEPGAIAASVLGFAGVLVILGGQAEAGLGPEAFAGAAAILVSAILYAYNIVLMRRQALVAGPVEIAFFMSLIMTACFALAAPFLAFVPEVEHVPALAGAALLAFVSLMLLSWAYARAEAQHLAPVEYTAFIWASLFGFLLFGEAVRPPTLVGAAMIVGACLMAARRRPVPVAEAAP